MPERCVDASVAIKWVIKEEPWRKAARKCLRDTLATGVVLIAPPLFQYETESVIQRRLHAGIMTVEEADLALARLAIIGVRIVAPRNLVDRAREIARQFRQPRIYDALYAALAALRGCEFWTADKAFYDDVQKELLFVKYLPDYQGQSQSPPEPGCASA
jgi:predicted nucleic acid-binding protein